MIRVHINRTISYTLNVIIAYLLIGVLYELNLLKFTQHDYIPFLSSSLILYLDIIILILAAALSGKDLQLSALYSFCKHNSHLIMGCFFVLEIITYAKVVLTTRLFIAYIEPNRRPVGDSLPSLSTTIKTASCQGGLFCLLSSCF